MTDGGDGSGAGPGRAAEPTRRTGSAAASLSLGAKIREAVAQPGPLSAPSRNMPTKKSTTSATTAYVFQRKVRLPGGW
ncbi:MAG: hypothetical protein SangKO_026320 [Sandaracinaceae bacterium]